MTSSSDEISPSTDVTRLQELLTGLIGSLVDRPDSFRVEAESGDGGVTFKVFVSHDDLGKVIGKQGRTARAIRTVLGAVASKKNQRFSLDVLEA